MIWALIIQIFTMKKLLLKRLKLKKVDLEPASVFPKNSYEGTVNLRSNLHPEARDGRSSQECQAP